MYMSELLQYGFVRKKEGDKKKGFTYEVVNYEEYKNLQSHISNTLDEILHRLQAQESKQVKKGK
jgi:predicted transcriptional regulator